MKNKFLSGLKLEQFFTKFWYQPLSFTWTGLVLAPLSLLYYFIVKLRVIYYQYINPSQKLSAIPIIVVGNICVGGSGKTSLVKHLVTVLKQAGYHPGIVSRGYRRKGSKPQLVLNTSSIDLVGDEPYLLSKLCQVPVAVAKQRQQAVKLLLDSNTIDIILADDGLQHYAMARDLEIAVIDAELGHGNGQVLPLGPLREPIARLDHVDLIIYHHTQALDQHWSMYFDHAKLVSLDASSELAIGAFANTPMHAVIGIGHPVKFIKVLSRYQITVIAHIFVDHHAYKLVDLMFEDDYPIVMSEKDAIKCYELIKQLPFNAQKSWLDKVWQLSSQLIVDPNFDQALLQKLKDLKHG